MSHLLSLTSNRRFNDKLLFFVIQTMLTNMTQKRELLTFIPKLNELISKIANTTMSTGDKMKIVVNLADRKDNIATIEKMTINEFTITVPQRVLIDDLKLDEFKVTHRKCSIEYEELCIEVIC